MRAPRPPRSRVVAIGDELLNGSRVDSNSAVLGAWLTRNGYAHLGTRTVGDEVAAIVAALATAAHEADLILVTGGLGPTPDDRTRQALSAWSESDLREDPAVVAALQARADAAGRPMGRSNRVQALVPSAGRAILNPAGTAPALVLCHCGVTLVAMPGVPSEVAALLEGPVGEFIADWPGLLPFTEVQVRTTRVAESILADQLRGVPRDPRISLAYLPHLTGVDLVLQAPKELRGLLEAETRAIVERIMTPVFALGHRTLEEIVGETLSSRDLKVAIAESCTGGLILSRLTDVPGASRYVVGGVVAYANEGKVSALGVRASTLEHHGAVSEPAAIEMAEGLRERSKADLALATTGIAGPGGGSNEKPVGTIWVALADAHQTKTELLRLTGTRAQIKARATQYALDLLRLHLAPVSSNTLFPVDD